MIIGRFTETDPANCLNCHIRKLDQTSAFCSLCGRMLSAVARRPYFVRLSEEWYANGCEGEQDDE
jgi:ribosomal protein L34E